ncbi:MAG: twin-arginine translocation pathway signal protein [Acidobacteria bacterium]|nr:MAG: twin-arginine translocation pathway signal protein [Acidobacteriota bacterium]REJ97963.1 MAG: twin-arginine translocation pathway signal protein [Acidobacteriota bacterium]REK16706.1 MAG: twin-arginine translocation pathway signal protein [Acidobacteriota bacterium]REK42617.1 MAG: twin-arginine translocation pathway signal protein [Acidobacteriota bacterium]
MVMTFRSLALSIAIFAATFAACAGAVEVTESERRAGEEAAELAADSDLIASGALEGRGGHAMSGTVSLRQSGSGYILEFGDDFVFDGAPAPVVAFGREGYRKETQIGSLRQNEGKHFYRIPAAIKTGDFDEVWVWCTDYDVPLGTAKLVRR